MQGRLDAATTQGLLPASARLPDALQPDSRPCFAEAVEKPG